MMDDQQETTKCLTQEESSCNLTEEPQWKKTTEDDSTCLVDTDRLQIESSEQHEKGKLEKHSIFGFPESERADSMKEDNREHAIVINEQETNETKQLDIIEDETFERPANISTNIDGANTNSNEHQIDQCPSESQTIDNDKPESGDHLPSPNVTNENSISPPSQPVHAASLAVTADGLADVSPGKLMETRDGLPSESEEDSSSSSTDSEADSSSSEEDSDDSSEESTEDSSSSGEWVAMRRQVLSDEDDNTSIAPLTTLRELQIQDLPKVEPVDIVLEPGEEVIPLGTVSSIIGQLVVVHSELGVAALDIDTVLFTENRRAFGKVFDVFGPVVCPLYTVRFNDLGEIARSEVALGMKVYFAPNVKDITQYVFMQKLKQMKGSDASWEHDEEPPPEFVVYSDDEQERRAKNGGKESANRRKRNRQRNRRENQQDVPMATAERTPWMRQDYQSSNERGYHEPPNHPGRGGFHMPRPFFQRGGRGMSPPFRHHFEQRPPAYCRPTAFNRPVCPPPHPNESMERPFYSEPPQYPLRGNPFYNPTPHGGVPRMPHPCTQPPPPPNVPPFWPPFGTPDC